MNTSDALITLVGMEPAWEKLKAAGWTWKGGEWTAPPPKSGPLTIKVKAWWNPFYERYVLSTPWGTEKLPAGWGVNPGLKLSDPMRGSWVCVESDGDYLNLRLVFQYAPDAVDLPLEQCPGPETQCINSATPTAAKDWRSISAGALLCYIDAELDYYQRLIDCPEFSHGARENAMAIKCKLQHIKDHFRL